MSSAVDGAALRANWDAACDGAIAAVDRARADAPPAVASYLGTQAKAVASIKAAVDGRRQVPRASTGIGILHDIPPEVGAPEYAEALEALDAVRKLWDRGLDAEGWDWDRGFPPSWPDRPGDRLHAGLLYRKR